MSAETDAAGDVFDLIFAVALAFCAWALVVISFANGDWQWSGLFAIFAVLLTVLVAGEVSDR